jgi:hypothetical protein
LHGQFEELKVKEDVLQQTGKNGVLEEKLHGQFEDLTKLEHVLQQTVKDEGIEKTRMDNSRTSWNRTYFNKQARMNV